MTIRDISGSEMVLLPDMLTVSLVSPEFAGNWVILFSHIKLLDLQHK
jgi:hypothetical protein